MHFLACEHLLSRKILFTALRFLKLSICHIVLLSNLAKTLKKKTLSDRRISRQLHPQKGFDGFAVALSAVVRGDLEMNAHLNYACVLLPLRPADLSWSTAIAYL